MHELQSSNPRKRQRETRLSGTSQSPLKKPKLGHLTTGSKAPVTFWDTLSTIWLTKRALNELGRRNIQAAPTPPCPSNRSSQRSVTRGTPADVKTYARQGGPDLSDLRGVCIAGYLMVPELTALSSSTRARSTPFTAR